MAESALIRTGRALDLIPYIVEHPGTSIEELSQKFNTTPNEISKTLDTLFMCGLPGYTHLELIDLTTEDGFVSVLDPQNLSRPRKLSQVEILSLLLGLENLKAQFPGRSVTLIESAAVKLRTLLGKMEVLNHVAVVAENIAPDHLELIESAIREGCCISFRYSSVGSDETSVRITKPLNIYSRNGFFYMQALDDQGVTKNFRMDRMAHVERNSFEFSFHSTEAHTELISIDVEIPKSALHFLEDSDRIVSTIEIVGERKRVTLQVAKSDWLLRALSAIPGEVVILSPRGVAEEFKEIAQEALALYAS